MTDAPISLSFFDPPHRLSGTARVGVTLLFEGTKPTTVPTGPHVVANGAGWHAELEDHLALDFEPLSEPIALAGSTTRLCRVTGTVGVTRVSCLGTATHTSEPPSWRDLDAMRTLSAVFDGDNALFAVARRPRGAAHGEEKVDAKLLVGGEVTAVEDTRLSTVYDGEGRQRSAGLELWLPEEEYPHRGSGTVEAGASLTLEGLRVNAAMFKWRMEGRDGSGAYEIAVRDDGATA